MQRHIRWLWAGLMLVLPISSFPPIARLIGVQSVAALSIVFLLALFLLWFIPYLWRGGRLPAATLPLLVFILAALLATLGSFLLPIPNFRDISRGDAILEGLVTLAVGISAYLLAASWPAQKNDLAFLLRWLNYGGGILVLWSGAQAYYALIAGGYPAWMETLQAAISSSGQLYYRRVTGLAFEPSWLAHQLNMIYLPWWLAATLRNTSAHGFRIWKLSLENILLICGVATLIASFSRVGWLAFLVVLAYVILLASIKLVKWLQHQLSHRWTKQGWQIFGKTALPVLLSVALIAVYAGMFLGAGYGLSRLDPRMRQLFDFQTLRQEGFLMFANRLVFAERIVFWQTGFEVFNDYPVLGVGIGNAGYFFPEKMPAFGYGLTEVSRLLFEQSNLPNTKALWSRLAAETGLVGLALFLTWLFVLFRSGLALAQSHERDLQAVGLFGQLVIVGLLIEGFSLDTFALPYYWLSLGFLTSGFRLWSDEGKPTEGT